jgi:hypothetical protein
MIRPLGILGRDGFGLRAMIGCRRSVSRGLAILVILLSAVSSSAFAETFMTVGDVAVDVTAKSAAAARDQAIAQAQAKAFDRLVGRLVPNSADQARIRPSQQDIEAMVQDFEIENERVSPVRYIGVYSVRFRAGMVEKYLADAGVTGVGQLQQVLILPVYRGANGAVLWGQGNPWRIAWERGGFGDGPVSLILPNGDAFDLGTLTAGTAESGGVAALGAMIQRYHVAGIVVATAEPRDAARGAASGLTITATTYDASGLKGAQTLTVTPGQGEQPDGVLLRGVSATAAALEDGWKSGSTGLSGYVAQQSAAADDGERPSSPSSAGTLYPLTVNLSGLEGWVAMRDRLTAIIGVEHVSLDALTRDGAALTVDFDGDTLAFQAALAGTGYVLAQTAPPGAAGPSAFQLRRAGAPNQSMPNQSMPNQSMPNQSMPGPALPPPVVSR